MNVDTAIIRRLRDALLEDGDLSRRVSGAAMGQVTTRARENAAVARFTPFAEIMYFVMMVDEEADIAEYETIRGAMRVLTDSLLPDTALEDIFQRCRERVGSYGVESCLQETAARLCADRQDRETAFTLAAAVALADDRVMPRELDLIADIAQWCGISSKRASALLEEL